MKKNQTTSASFQERLQLYRRNNQPRKEIRVKLQTITQGIWLPSNKVKKFRHEHFKMNKKNKDKFCIQCKNSIRYSCIQSIRNSQEKQNLNRNKNLQVIKLQNQLRVLSQMRNIYRKKKQLSQHLNHLKQDIERKSQLIMLQSEI